MALILTDVNALYLHSIKSGGNWVRRVLEHLEIPHEYSEGNCGHPHALRHHFDEKFDFVFCTVRHPRTFFVSHYRHMKQAGHKALQWFSVPWHPARVFAECTGASFGQFIENIIQSEPAVWTRYMEQVAGPSRCDGREHLDCIMRHEILKDDLIKVLNTLGYKVGRSDLESVMPVNISRGEVPNWNKKQWKTMQYLEGPGLNRFFPDRISVV